MFDGGSSSRDTEVVDLPISRPRTRTEDPVMHVMTGGEWHRRLPDLSATSCGTAYHSQFAPVRREELKHPLCPGVLHAVRARARGRGRARAERRVVIRNAIISALAVALFVFGMACLFNPFARRP